MLPAEVVFYVLMLMSMTYFGIPRGAVWSESTLFATETI